ncbi:caspase family protein [Micromonospora sp. NBC_01796]|uniref:caspase family protein n=1 Tax=Micromonospora sp. NBC_01796 TaxID=2975987 RepID=UPI002DD8E344|nr:caspase family protein [Micromonospora sp. NBC_01796]WSA88937.1 caspase family protein [Micromonospora sp. NBC_01796]
MTRLPDPEHSRAFLIGTATYQSDQLPDLPAVRNNLTDLRATLTAPLLGGFAPDRCVMLADPPDPVSLYNMLLDHAANTEDTLLVYFAGHGRTAPRGKLYLGLTNTGETNLPVSGFDYELLRDLVMDSKAVNKVVVLDCCFSGRAIQGMSGAGAATAEQLEIEGTYVLTATAANAQALAPPGAHHTSFTGELLHVLGSGVPDAGELLSLDAVFKQLRHNVRQRGLPVPEQRFGGMTHQLALTRNAAAARTAEPAAPPPAPPPRISMRQAYVAQPLVLAGALHFTKQDLAATIRRNWATAAEHLFPRTARPAAPSESWTELLAWLRQFNDPVADDVEGRIALVDRYLTDRKLPADLKVLHLLRWLDPDGAATYLGHHVTYQMLARGCLGTRVDADDVERRLFEEVSRPGLLDALSGFAELDGLQGVQRKWDGARRAWEKSVEKMRFELGYADVRGNVPEWAATNGPGALLFGLLPQDRVSEISRNLPTGSPPQVSIPWYERLLTAAGGRETVLGALLEADLAPVAEQTARDRVESERQREAEREDLRRRAEQWSAAEASRLSGAARYRAVLRALAVTGGWSLILVIAVWLAWCLSSRDFETAKVLTFYALTLGGAAAFVLVRCGHRLGSAYHPEPGRPSSWLPSVRAAIFGVAVMVLFGVTARPPREGPRADFELLREWGPARFWEYVSNNSDYYRADWSLIWYGILVALGFAACLAVGAYAGVASARQWEERHRAYEQAHRPG